MNTCFFVSPIGDDDSETRRAIDGLLEAAIRPALKELGFKVIAAQEIAEPGSITAQVLEHLLYDPLVIANVTDLNPNVMYELGVRHSVALPVVTIFEKETKLPFDIADERGILYTNDMAGIGPLVRRLKEAVTAAMEKQEPIGPVYRVARAKVMREPSRGSDTDLLIAERLDWIESAITRLGQTGMVRSVYEIPPGIEVVITGKADPATLEEVSSELQGVYYKVGGSPVAITANVSESKIQMTWRFKSAMDVSDLYNHAVSGGLRSVRVMTRQTEVHNHMVYDGARR